MGTDPWPVHPITPKWIAISSPQQGNGGHQLCALSLGDQEPPSVNATAGLCTPFQDSIPSAAQAVDSAVLWWEKQVNWWVPVWAGFRSR